MSEKSISREKAIILTARVISMLFTPFYLPLVGLMALFMFSYLGLMPWGYKLQVLTLVYLFTILLPTVLIHLYRRYQGWTLIELGHKERRAVPYVISILCYFFCVYLMDMMHIPHFMGTIVAVAMAIQVVCALINVWWKISTHTAAICLWRTLRLQPHLVAYSGHDFGRYPGLQSYDSASALAGSGGGRFLGRAYLCLLRSYLPLVSKIVNK